MTEQYPEDLEAKRLQDALGRLLESGLTYEAQLLMNPDTQRDVLRLMDLQQPELIGNLINPATNQPKDGAYFLDILDRQDLIDRHAGFLDYWACREQALPLLLRMESLPKEHALWGIMSQQLEGFIAGNQQGS